MNGSGNDTADSNHHGSKTYRQWKILFDNYVFPHVARGQPIEYLRRKTKNGNANRGINNRSEHIMKIKNLLHELPPLFVIMPARACRTRDSDTERINDFPAVGLRIAK